MAELAIRSKTTVDKDEATVVNGPKVRKNKKVKKDKVKSGTGKKVKGKKTKVKDEKVPYHGPDGMVIKHDKITVGKKVAAGVDVHESENGSTKGTYTLPSGESISVSTLLRALGYKLATPPRAIKVMSKLGVPVRKWTVLNQVNTGRRLKKDPTYVDKYGRNKPKLSKEDWTHVKELLVKHGGQSDSDE
jgi:hypothetical protein